jgi:FixJ family two-component response regulator
MALVGDLIKEVVETALQEIIKKATGTGRRARRRKRSATTTRRRRRTTTRRRSASYSSRRRGRPNQPAKRQVSRRRTVRTRSRYRRKGY